jgi:hypothetical protein
MNIGIIFENWIFRLESNPFLRRMAHHCLPTELGLFQKEFNVTILVWFVSSSWKRKCTLLIASTNFTIMFFNLFFKTTNDQRAIVAMTLWSLCKCRNTKCFGKIQIPHLTRSSLEQRIISTNGDIWRWQSIELIWYQLMKSLGQSLLLTHWNVMWTALSLLTTPLQVMGSVLETQMVILSMENLVGNNVLCTLLKLKLQHSSCSSG